MPGGGQHTLGVLSVPDPSPVLALLLQPQSLRKCALMPLTKDTALLQAGKPEAQ